ncbi:MAG: hypothetical protein E7168_04615, partial [Firmicutes bacterium]|nr:hypothetical protein [Bacillota bacterium]
MGVVKKMIKNKKGFTLVEILGVLVFLGIIMIIAIPNVISILEKNRKTNYVKEAEKLVSTVKYEIRNQNNKPEEGEIVKISLSCLN